MPIFALANSYTLYTNNYLGVIFDVERAIILDLDNPNESERIRLLKSMASKIRSLESSLEKANLSQYG